MQIATETVNLRPSSGQHSQDREQTSVWRWYPHLLPVAAAAIYMFTPILTWRFGVPDAIKFLGDLIVIAMIGLAIGRMLLTNRIPGAFLVILAVTIIGGIVAAFEGQSSDVTFYGWWMLFRFPMVGLYVYLIGDWPRNTAALIPKVMLYLLGFQVVVQILLYLSGVRDFDNLAGTFGHKGVGPFIYFVFFVLALALGKWLAIGEWKMLAIALLLGSIASAIGEMKLFLIATPLMAAAALGIHLLRGAQLRRVVLYLAFFAVAAASFLLAYDRFIVQGLGKPPLEDFLNSEKRDRYLDFARGAGDFYRLGRNSEVEYGWQLIQRDETTLLFGHGLGTRQYSPELGLIGAGVQGSLYGLFVGRSLLVMIYEMGLVGITAMLLFALLTSAYLFRAVSRVGDADMNVIRYGVLLYTLFWPVWIWYSAVWIMAAPAVLYWMIWGYVIHYTVNPSNELPQASPPKKGRKLANFPRPMPTQDVVGG